MQEWKSLGDCIDGLLKKHKPDQNTDHSTQQERNQERINQEHDKRKNTETFPDVL